MSTPFDHAPRPEGTRPRGRAAASAQLSSLATARASLADRAMQPWWYDAALGVVVGVSDSVLSKHVKQLEDAGCVRIGKATGASRCAPACR